MEILGFPPHTVLAIAAGVAGPVACALTLWFVVRVDRRDTWRYPMMIAVTVATATILGAFVSGDRMLDGDPRLGRDPMVLAHQQYAARLVLPTIGFWVMASLTGFLNPRTGVLKTMLPLILAGFAVVVLVLVLLSGDADARSLWESVRDQF